MASGGMGLGRKRLRNVQVIFAKATCIKRAQKRVVYEGPNTSGEMEYDECLWPTSWTDEEHISMMNAGFPWFPKKAVAYHSFAVASEKSFGDCVPTEVLGKCNASHLEELRRVCQIRVRCWCWLGCGNPGWWTKTADVHCQCFGWLVVLMVGWFVRQHVSMQHQDLHRQ